MRNESGLTRALVKRGQPMRVRRLTGSEAERYRAPSGEALVAVVELAVSLPAGHVEGCEAHLADRLRELEQGGPEAARAFLGALHR